MKRIRRYKAYRVIRNKGDEQELKAWKKIVKELKEPKKVRDRKNPRTYETYIKSSLWENRKKKYWKLHKKQCAACKDFKFVELHHAVYSGFKGDEKDNELFPFCRSCHQELHWMFGTKKDMLDETLTFIEIKKSGAKG